MLTLGLETAKEMAARGGEAAVVERLGTLVQLSKKTLLDTRNLLFDLKGAVMGGTRLGTLVRMQAEEFAAVTGVRVETAVEGPEPHLSPAVTAEILRVVQEALANVYRHAHASDCRVSIANDNRGLTIVIADGGRGFDREGRRDRGSGMANMEDRSARLGGSLSIVSVPGEGTVVTMHIPHAEATAA